MALPFDDLQRLRVRPREMMTPSKVMRHRLVDVREDRLRLAEGQIQLRAGLLCVEQQLCIFLQSGIGCGFRRLEARIENTCYLVPHIIPRHILSELNAPNDQQMIGRDRISRSLRPQPWR